MCEQPLLLYGNDVKNREKKQQAVCVVFSHPFLGEIVRLCYYLCYWCLMLKS